MFFSSPDQGQDLPFSTKAASFFLLAGLLVYPFTIAGSNFFFALLLITIILFQRDIFMQGWNVCWQEYRHITIGVLLLIGFNIIGSLWSTDVSSALHSVGKTIYWLFLPLIAGLVLASPSLLKKIFMVVSIGLTFHLLICTLQLMRIITITGDIGGTSATNPAGLVGHLSFGFIYAIWAGLLLILAPKKQTIWKYIYYILSAYSITFIFLTEGRSGYLITLLLIVIIFWKEYLYKLSIHGFFSLIIAAAILTCLFFTFNETAKNRAATTIAGVQLYLDGNLSNTPPRLKIWAITVDIWLDKPWTGIGTGSFKKEFIEKVKLNRYKSYKYTNTTFGTPHNEYLFTLLQWGPLGLVIFLYLLISILYKGLLGINWETQPLQGYLLTSIGVAVGINALSATPLSTAVTAVATALVLGFGMSAHTQKET